MARVTVADVLIDTLAGVGVKRIYGVVGDSLNGITDSLQRKKIFSGFTRVMKNQLH